MKRHFWTVQECAGEGELDYDRIVLELLHYLVKKTERNVSHKVHSIGSCMGDAGSSVRNCHRPTASGHENVM